MPNQSLNELLDLSVSRLKPLRRRVYQFRLRSKKYRQQVLDELALSLLDDTDFQALAPEGVTVFNGDAEDPAGVKFQIDPANLEKILELIIKYLPIILDLINKLFAALIAFILFTVCSSSAMAQCPGGRCPQQGGLFGGGILFNRQPVQYSQPTYVQPTYSQPVQYVQQPVQYAQPQVVYSQPASVVVQTAPKLASQTAPVLAHHCPCGAGCPCGANCACNSRTVVNALPQKPGHWSYPGDLSNHLNTEHRRQLQQMGINTAGLSREELLNLHDSLHEVSWAVPPKVPQYSSPVSVQSNNLGHRVVYGN